MSYATLGEDWLTLGTSHCETVRDGRAGIPNRASPFGVFTLNQSTPWFVSDDVITQLGTYGTPVPRYGGTRRLKRGTYDLIQSMPLTFYALRITHMF